MRNDRGASISIAKPEGAWSRFWFTPIAPTGLHVLRVLGGLLFLAWLLTFIGQQKAFFSLNGWIDRDAFFAMQRQPGLAPAPITWSILYWAGDSADTLQAIYWASIGIIALFTLGVATRITGVLTWIVVVSFVANPASSYDGDYLLAVLAFYLAIGYLYAGFWNGHLSMLEKILGASDHLLWRWSEERSPSIAANLALRALQIHVAIILVSSGLHKLQISDWWAGVALWYPLHRPFDVTAAGLQREIPDRTITFFCLSLITYAVLAWQLAFPLFAWRRGWWRAVLLGGALAGWAACVFLWRLPLFGPFFTIGALSYLSPEEWAWIADRAGNLVGSSAVAAPAKVPAKV